MAEEPGLFESMYSQRALRYIRPEPIPDALVRKVLEAGTRAPIKEKGYPSSQNRYGPTNRRAVEDVTFGETWGRSWEAGT